MCCRQLCVQKSYPCCNTCDTQHIPLFPAPSATSSCNPAARLAMQSQHELDPLNHRKAETNLRPPFASTGVPSARDRLPICPGTGFVTEGSLRNRQQLVSAMMATTEGLFSVSSTGTGRAASLQTHSTQQGAALRQQQRPSNSQRLAALEGSWGNPVPAPSKALLRLFSGAPSPFFHSDRSKRGKARGSSTVGNLGSRFLVSGKRRLYMQAAEQSGASGDEEQSLDPNSELEQGETNSDDDGADPLSPGAPSAPELLRQEVWEEMPNSGDALDRVQTLGLPVSGAKEEHGYLNYDDREGLGEACSCFPLAKPSAAHNTGSSRTYTVLWWYNVFACFIHFMAMLLTVILASSRDKWGIHWKLKVDSVYVGNSPGRPPPGTANLTKTPQFATSPLFQPYPPKSFPLFGGCLQNASFIAEPNVLPYGSDAREGEYQDLTIYTYASNAEMKVYLVWLIFAFFALSWVFQAVCLTKSFRWHTGLVGPAARGHYGWMTGNSSLYQLMFSGMTFLSANQRVYAGNKAEGGLIGKQVAAARFYLVKVFEYGTINYLRYVEYSFSASCMILAICMFAGITDADTLACIVALTWACMMCGWVAEQCLRAYQCLDFMILYKFAEVKQAEGVRDAGANPQNIQWSLVPPAPSPAYNPGSAAAGVPQTEIDLSTLAHLKGLEYLRSTCYQGGCIAHFIGWVCIIIPWFIIWGRYSQWFETGPSTSRCAADYLVYWKGWSTGEAAAYLNSQGADMNRSPPDFVRGIIWSQIILFLSFGFVQVFQFMFPYKRASAEFAYITLSATAKVLLGSFIAWGLLA